jgi:multiple sugar transport system substrate-binding protein
MSVRWKRSSVLLAITAAVAVVAVSVASAKTSVGPASTAKQQSTLSIMGFGKGDDVAQTRFAIAAKAVGGGIDNPNGGFNDQQFLAAVASGNVPDLVYLDRQKLGTYAAKGALVPLTSCIKSQKIDMSQYRIPAVNEVTYNKQIYGIPEFYSVRTIIVDNKVLDQTHTPIGWLNPAKPDLLLKAAKQMAVVQNGKVTRIGFDPKIEAFFPLWAKAYGVDILSKDGLHAHLNDPRAVKALTYAMSLINAQGGWNAFISFRNTWDFFGSDNQVEKNQVGAWPMEDWYYGVLAGSSPDVHITALQFRNLKNQPINYETGNAWAIPKGAKHPGAACTFAKVMTEPSTWLAAAKNRAQLRAAKNQPYQGINTANAVADKEIYNQTYKKGQNKYFDEAVAKIQSVMRYSFGIPASPAGAEFQTAWQSAVTRVQQGQQSPKQALDQAQKEAQSAIDAAK